MGFSVCMHIPSSQPHGAKCQSRLGTKPHMAGQRMYCWASPSMMRLHIVPACSRSLVPVVRIDVARVVNTSILTLATTSRECRGSHAVSGQEDNSLFEVSSIKDDSVLHAHCLSSASEFVDMPSQSES